MPQDKIKWNFNKGTGRMLTESKLSTMKPGAVVRELPFGSRYAVRSTTMNQEREDGVSHPGLESIGARWLFWKRGKAKW
jgi:hypothetical protein